MRRVRTLGRADEATVGVVTAKLRVDVLPATAAADEELDAFFDRCETSFAQQTRHWRDVIAPLAGDVPGFLGCFAGDDLVGVLPTYRFDGPLGSVLNSVPQAGPLGGVAIASGIARASVYRELLGGFVEHGRASGCAAASVISNPFWPDDDLYRQYLAPDYTLENRCLVLDLRTSVDAAGGFPNASHHLRRNLRRAHAAALRIDEEQTEENVEAWYTIHSARHRAIGATPLPFAMFTGALHHMVSRDKARFFFVRRTNDDALVAGGLYLFHGRVIDALMPSVSDEAAKLGANYLLAEHSIHWARARGLHYYNWQGSPPGGGVYRFKQQWGSTEARYCYFTRATGDIEPFLASTPAFVGEAYRWHFPLPFDHIGGSGSAGRISTRKAAWDAADQGR